MPDDLSVFSPSSLTIMAQAAIVAPELGRLVSGQAALRVEIEVERFNLALTAYVNEFHREVEQTVRQVSNELLYRIRRRTPVDTRRLQNSFHAVMPGEIDTYTYTDDLGRSFDGTLTEHPHAENTDETIEAIVGTNVPYAIYIEAGHSRQAPNGMVAISRAEMASTLEALVARAIGGA